MNIDEFKNKVRNSLSDLLKQPFLRHALANKLTREETIAFEEVALEMNVKSIFQWTTYGGSLYLYW